jgi:hypothetical protein
MSVSEHVDADFKTRKVLLGLCALKSRTGHLEGLAGAAGPVRVCLVLAIGVMISSMYFRSPGFRVSSNGSSNNILAKGKCSILKLESVGILSSGFGSANIRVAPKFFQIFVERQHMGSPNAALLNLSVWGTGLRRRDVEVDPSVTVFGNRFRIQTIKADVQLGGRHSVSVQKARVS